VAFSPAAHELRQSGHAYGQPHAHLPGQAHSQAPRTPQHQRDVGTPLYSHRGGPAPSELTQRLYTHAHTHQQQAQQTHGSYLDQVTEEQYDEHDAQHYRHASDQEDGDYDRLPDDEYASQPARHSQQHHSPPPALAHHSVVTVRSSP
jgi:hypothetical protein